MPYYNYFNFPSKPLEAVGGIKAQSKRGSFGQSWWAKRWIEVLEGFNIDSRLSRGRSYARNGQVLSIDIAAGIVKAKVQGSYPTPYEVEIKLATLEPGNEEKLAKTLVSELAIAARVLSGDMPPEIEATFAAAGISLFPQRDSDLKTKCSCPDWSNPCKHIAATYYLLGEEFNRDPFLLLKLRGIDRQRLMDLLSTAMPILKMISAMPESKQPSSKKPDEKKSTPALVSASKMSFETDEEVDAFWQGTEIPGAPQSNAIESSNSAFSRLGAFPFWSGEQPLAEALNPIYGAASKKGLALYVGDSLTELKD